MSGPIYGGRKSLNEPGAKRKGLYAEHPAFTPKYNASSGIQSTLDTQARLYIPVASPEVHDRIMGALPARARPYARAMVQKGPQVAGRVYVDFILQNVNETLNEKVQVSEVLSDAHVAYFFGQRTPVWSYSGIVLNTQQDPWYDAWHILYQDLLRGSKLAEHGVPVVLSYDTRRVIGSIQGQSTGLRAQNELFASMQFQMIVREVQYDPDRDRDPTDLEVAATQVQGGSFPAPSQYVSSMHDTIDAVRSTLSGQNAQDTVASDVRPGANTQEVESKTGVTSADDTQSSGVQVVPDRLVPEGVVT